MEYSSIQPWYNNKTNKQNKLLNELVKNTGSASVIEGTDFVLCFITIYRHKVIEDTLHSFHPEPIEERERDEKRE